MSSDEKQPVFGRWSMRQQIQALRKDVASLRRDVERLSAKATPGQAQSSLEVAAHLSQGGELGLKANETVIDGIIFADDSDKKKRCRLCHRSSRRTAMMTIRNTGAPEGEGPIVCAGTFEECQKAAAVSRKAGHE